MRVAVSAQEEKEDVSYRCANVCVFDGRNPVSALHGVADENAPAPHDHGRAVINALLVYGVYAGGRAGECECVHGARPCA